MEVFIFRLCVFNVLFFCVVLVIILFLKIKIEGNFSIYVCILIVLIFNEDWFV